MTQVNNSEEISAVKIKSAADYISLAITTFGVGYLPLAPGTWGSLAGIGIYLIFRWFETNLASNFVSGGFSASQITAWIHIGNLIIFLLFCLLGIWASNRATVLFGNEDPPQAVVDEIIGQILTFFFVPLAISGWMIFAGFALFRLFDIWKPYPIDALQNLHGGLGICADDILAGVYAGTGLLLIYALSITFF
ncbi:MAG: phosphatidylglycerophosphatase A family protein [Pyrinomonadaceae bacterium]